MGSLKMVFGIFIIVAVGLSVGETGAALLH